MAPKKSEKYWETAEFKRTQKEWYQKAADSGFRDIEDPVTGELEGTKHQVSIDAYPENGDADPYLDKLLMEQSGGVAARRDYYVRAEHFLHGNRHWKAAGDKAAWALHSEGLSFREIAKVVGRPWTTIAYRIEVMQKQAGLQRREKRLAEQKQSEEEES